MTAAERECFERGDLVGAGLALQDVRFHNPSPAFLIRCCCLYTHHDDDVLQVYVSWLPFWLPLFDTEAVFSHNVSKSGVLCNPCTVFYLNCDY